MIKRYATTINFLNVYWLAEIQILLGKASTGTLNQFLMAKKLPIRKSNIIQVHAKLLRIQ
jgi:hypothetical protein